MTTNQTSILSNIFTGALAVCNIIVQAVDAYRSFGYKSQSSFSGTILLSPLQVLDNMGIDEY